jgi:transposase
VNVDDVVAEKIAAAAARAEAAKRRRAAFKAARQRGLAARHAQKLRNLSVRTTDGSVSVSPTETNDTDDVVVEVTEAEFHAAVRTSLARLGLTYAELEDQARRRDFTSAQAHSLWVSIGGAVNTDLLNPKETS